MVLVVGIHGEPLELLEVISCTWLLHLYQTSR
jgi:hypothetical protein